MATQLPSHFRPLVPVPIPAAIEPSDDVGTAPELVWLTAADLVVDKRYQREIGDRGMRNIRKIVENYHWDRFTPVIVARVEGGKYAIVDGQHRATAALTHGKIDKLPCAVISADERMQARAFMHINGAVTKVSAMQLYHAGIAAGDPDCLMIEKIAADSNVTILKYPKQECDRRPGETMCAGLIARLVKLHGARPVRLALSGLRKADDGGLITASTLRGVVYAVVNKPELARDDDRFIRALGNIKHYEVMRRAEMRRVNDRRAVWLLYAECLIETLADTLKN